jgi:hypothetical protein
MAEANEAPVDATRPPSFVGPYVLRRAATALAAIKTGRARYVRRASAVV